MVSSNTTSVTGGAGTSSPSMAHEFTRSFYLQVLYFCCRYAISKKPKCGIETAFLSRTPPVSLGVLVLQSLAFCVVIVDHCMSFFLFPLVIVLSVIRFIVSHYPFGIFYLVGLSSYKW
jgi:hypothetical protein